MCLTHEILETLAGPEKVHFCSAFRNNKETKKSEKSKGVAMDIKNLRGFQHKRVRFLSAYLFFAARDDLERQGDIAFAVYNRCFGQFIHPYIVKCPKLFPPFL